MRSRATPAGRSWAGLEKSLRELFYLSHEYEDNVDCHRRVFHGHVVHGELATPITYFMMTVPHSHTRFEYVGAPRVQLAPRDVDQLD